MNTHLRRHHVETHLKSTDLLRDVVIGMSDGLTVPFALAAGLSGAVADSRIIVCGNRSNLLYFTVVVTHCHSTLVPCPMPRRQPSRTVFQFAVTSSDRHREIGSGIQEARHTVGMHRA